MEEKRRMPHNLTLSQRERCSFSGVNDVISFDEQEAVMNTDLGGLVISGHDLHVTSLSVDTGEISLEGKIDAVRYMDKAVRKAGESLWQRIWK